MTDARPVVVVETAEALAALVKAVGEAPSVGVDTESNSFHAYREKVCLVQLSTAASDYVVDPLAVDVRPLGPLFADPEREVVFHAAEYDIRSLKRDFGFTFRRLFDTQAAAMVLGAGQVGLAALVEEHFGVKLAKAWQRSDWGRRPLEPEQLRYAAGDTRYLLELRDILAGRVRERGRWDEAVAQFDRLCAIEPEPRSFDTEGFFRIKGYRNLDAAGRAIVRALYLAREERAAEIDRPPFKVLGNDAIVRLAEERPSNAKALARVRGVGSRARAAWGERLLDAVVQGLADAEPPPPRAPKRRRAPGQDEADARYDRLRAWRKALAAERGVQPQVIARSSVLKAIARANPRTLEALRAVPEADDWAVDRYGEAILRALADGG